MRVHVMEPHLVELVGDQIEDALAIGLRGEAAVTVTMAELLQRIVQVPHDGFLR